MRKRESGYVLLVILLMMALVLLTFSSAVVPILAQRQRESEKELIFRGEQYKHAIGLYYRKFGRFPMKIDDLLRTNDLSFLRRPYPDPMTRDGRWRLIRVGPAGQLIGSLNEHSPVGQAPAGMGGATGPPGSGQDKDSTASGTTGGMAAGSSGGDSGNSPYPIIGVASTSTGHSFQVYDDAETYDHWEFIYDPVKEALKGIPGVGGTPGAGGKPPGTGLGNSPTGTPPANNPKN